MKIGKIETEILERSSSKGRFCIAVSGFGGSGKTTVAQQLTNTLQEASIVNVDDFILNRLMARDADWSDVDWERLEKEVLIPWKKGTDVLSYEVYDWSKDVNAKNRQVSLSRFLIVEGVGLLRPAFSKYFDYSIWIDCEISEAIKRGACRDREEYKVNHDKQWEELWGPNDEDYFQKYNPKSLADVVLDCNY